MKICKTKEYRILAAVSGKCLTAGESNLITVEERDDRAEQLWKFVPEEDGSYRLVNAHSKKALDIIKGGSMNGAWTHLWEPLNTMTQMWVVEEEGDAVRLHSVSSDKYLDVALADNFHVQIWEKGGDNQLWKLEITEKEPTSIKAKEPSALKHPDPTAIKVQESAVVKEEKKESKKTAKSASKTKSKSAKKSKSKK